MLFSIPDVTQANEENGSKFWMFHVHVNGVLHCQVRYRQFAELNDQLKREFGDQIPSRSFPGKKLFGLSNDQLEDRRHLLEYYIQTITQDTSVSSSSIFNDFFRNAQKATRQATSDNAELDIYLMNGNKFGIKILSTDDTDEVLENAMRKIGLATAYFHYFGLFLMKVGGEIHEQSIVVRKLQDFESPYLSLKSTNDPHRIVIRKRYWSSKYDDDIMDDRIALNLLYVQVADDIERGWVMTSEKEKQRLSALKEAGSKKEFLNFARALKFYGYIQFNPCICDYPTENSIAVFAIGERELHISVATDQKGTVKEGKFQVQKIRCWKLCSKALASEKTDTGSVRFSFEYFFGADKLQWINVESDQGIMISMCLQGIVDEILREKEGRAIRLPKARRKSDSSSTSSQASLKTQRKLVHPVPSDMEDTSDAGATSPTKTITGKVQDFFGKKNGAAMNEVFEEIGDDDL